MAGREIGPPPTTVVEFSSLWRNWLYLVSRKIYKRTYTLEVHAFQSVSPAANPMVEGVIGIAPVVLADDTTDESRHLSFQLPIDWVSGTDLTVSVYFANVGVQTGVKTVITKLTYNAVAAEEDASGAGATLTDTVTLTSGVAANTYHTSGNITLPASALTLGDTIFLTLLRDATTDTCVGDVGYQTIIIQYSGFINHE